MEHLEKSDLLGFVKALNLLHADAGGTELSNRILRAAAEMIEADTIGFDIFSLSGRYGNLSWRNVEFDFTPERLESIDRHHHENPLFVESILNRRTDVLKLTDFMDVDDFRKTNIYRLIYGSLNADYQMTVALPISEEFTLACLFTREHKDFSERDRHVLQLLAPHFVNAVSNDMAFKRLAGLLENQICGMIVITQNNKSLVISKYAEDLLKRYFGDGIAEGALPGQINEWLKALPIPVTGDRFCREVRPFTVEGPDGRLTIRLVHDNVTGEQTLLLEERKHLTREMLGKLDLTTRESEVLYWIAQGKSDSEIAELCDISPRTVGKHAENIYDKLGVGNRAAAMRRALETTMGIAAGAVANAAFVVENSMGAVAVLG